MKTVYFDCDCKSLRCVVRFGYFQDEKDYLYMETYFNEVGFVKRVWQSIKYILGIYVPYSETVFGKETLTKLRDCCDEFLDYNLIPEQSRGLFDWMVKYDLQLAGKPKEIIATLIAKGADQLYKEGLENADPLPDEVARAMAESQERALEEALKDT